MDKLRAIELFTRLADLGSFTRVAEQTNSSKSMISKEISRLEEHLGARLLHRSTRNVRLTHVGEGYLQRAREILSKIDDADGFVQSLQERPAGKLKINLPMALGVLELSKMFADFMRRYPEIELDIHLGDEDVDLVEQGFDLGFRASSQILDSHYVGRPLKAFSYHVCAAPAYLSSHPEIRLPRDLRDHNCFVYRYFKGKNSWPIEDGVEVSGTLTANSVPFMLEAIKAGLGIGFLPDFICRPSLEVGEITEILPDAEKPKLTLYALYPVRHFVPPKIIQCIAFMERWFDPDPSDSP